MYNNFNEFIKKKNESMNVRKGIIAGTTGALIALGGCSGTDCPTTEKPKVQASKTTEREAAIQKYKIEMQEKKEKIKKKIEELKLKQQQQRNQMRPRGSHGGTPVNGGTPALGT
jgi:hypothetical protein